MRVQPPIITSSDCEGAGEVFTVSSSGSQGEGDRPPEQEHFFRSPKFLTVSSQLHLEAFVHEHPKVWTLSPTFRAEKSDTPRHVSEFWMLEAELWTEKLDDLLELVEDMLQNLIRGLQKTNMIQELIMAKGKGDTHDIEDSHIAEYLEERWKGFLRSPWPRIEYKDAISHLQEAVQSKEITFQHEVAWDKGLSLEHEKYIAACVGQGSPVFVTNYPSSTKPFYMSPSGNSSDGSRDTASTAACFDLLLPDGCEVVGGSLREHRLEHLCSMMHKRGFSILSTMNRNADSDPSTTGSDLDWYLDLRRYGSVPHGGFGLGFDRLLGYLAGVANVRDVVSWPRSYGHCDG